MRVTIRGSRTPCTDLPTGVERTVEYTSTVKRRVVKGFYELVRFEDDDTVGAEPALSDTSKSDQSPLSADEPPEPPARNASKPEWLAFLAAKGVEVPTNDAGETPGRDGLIHLWQQVSGGS